MPRRRVIVKGFQGRFVIFQLLCLAAALATFATLLFAPLINDLLKARGGSQGELAILFLHLQATMWPLLLGLFMGLAALFVLMSHRIAGPLNRFTRAFKDVQDGRLDVRVKARQDDYLRNEASELDKMIRSLAARIGAAQRRIADIETALSSIAGSAAPTRDDVARAVTGVSALKTELGTFVVNSADQMAYEMEKADDAQRSAAKGQVPSADRLVH